MPKPKGDCWIVCAIPATSPGKMSNHHPECPGRFPTVNAIARNFSTGRIDLICCLATPNLQNCLNLTKSVPIVFTSVANPILAGAGKSATDHQANVTGIATALAL
jgi:ABC-type uncharacterized transport system substrate-binding protein